MLEVDEEYRHLSNVVLSALSLLALGLAELRCGVRREHSKIFLNQSECIHGQRAFRWYFST